MLIKTSALALFAVLVLSACGGSEDEPAASTPGGTAASQAQSPAGDTPTADAPKGGTVDVSVQGKGMEGGCDAVHKMFQALEAGDRTAAKTLRDKAHELFNDFAAEWAVKDVDKAMNGAQMASTLEFVLPEEQIYQSDVAKDYRAICVAKFQAAALPG
jgi:hypothetical protein